MAMYVTRHPKRPECHKHTMLQIMSHFKQTPEDSLIIKHAYVGIPEDSRYCWHTAAFDSVRSKLSLKIQHPPKATNELE
jgi:hypothetical protein